MSNPWQTEKGQRILVVDDHKDMIWLLTKLSEGAGYAVLRVTIDEGSFTIPTTEVLGIISVPKSGEEKPEAWIEVAGEGGAFPPFQTPPAPSLPPAASGPPLAVGSMRSSNEPHRLETASGETIKVEKYWIEGGKSDSHDLGEWSGFPSPMS